MISREEVKRIIGESDISAINSSLVLAVIQAESDLNGNHKIDDNEALAVSHCGAKGLMQLMDATGEEWHQHLNITEPYNPFNPAQNIRIGTAYLRYLFGRFGAIDLALAAYNTGPGRVIKLLKKHDALSFYEIKDYLPTETKNYVKRILSNYKTILQETVEKER